LSDASPRTEASGEMAHIYQQYKLDPAWALPPTVLTK